MCSYVASLLALLPFPLDFRLSSVRLLLPFCKFRLSASSASSSRASTPTSLVKLPVGWVHDLSLALCASPLFFIQKYPCLFVFDKLDGTGFCQGSSTCLFSQCSSPSSHRTTIHCTLSLPRDPFPLFSYPHALSILPSFHTCRSQPRPL